MTAEILLSLLPGTLTALGVFLPAAWLVGKWGMRFAPYAVLAALIYVFYLIVSWVLAGVMGFTVAYSVFSSFRGHASAFHFLAPYTILSWPIAVFLMIRLVRKMNESERKDQKDCP